MGLDGVELLLDVEERFGIRIPDAHAARMRTAGELHFYVLGRLHRFKSARCQSAAVFYSVRRALIQAFGADRGRVRPGAVLADFLGGLVRTMIEQMPADAECQPEAVWDVLRGLIAKQAGVPRDSIRRETRFIEYLDLG